MFGLPPPVIPNLKPEVLAEFDDHQLFSLQMLQRTHEQVWPKLRALYKTGPPPNPHRYRPGDWVYVRRYQHQTLQPHWKGPKIVKTVLKKQTWRIDTSQFQNLLKSYSNRQCVMHTKIDM